MRLLVLNWQDRENPQAGGAEIHLHETFGRLAARGWDVTLVSSGWGGAAPRAELDGIRVHRVGGRHTYPLHLPGYVARTLGPGTGEPAFDLVVEDLNKVPVMAPTWLRPPTVLLVHHLFGATAFREAAFPVAAATWLLERPIPWIYRGIPTIAVSDSTRDDLVARGLSRALIQVIPNGIDLARYTPGPPVGVAARAGDGPAPEASASPPEVLPSAGDAVAAGAHGFAEPTVLYLGRLKRYKRVDLVLEGVAALRRRGLPVRVIVAGRGDHGPALEARARALGLGPDEAVFEGYVSEERKLELLRGAWVHALASPREGWGIANLEAAACGTPTVASDAPGLRDSVRHGETGFLVPHGDVAALADRIGALLLDRELRDRLSRGARRFAEGFAWDRTAADMALALEAAAR
jgi:glycosyltransferase involved in cell wall biosynthesis